MTDKDLEKTIDQNGPDSEPQILRNELGHAVDPTVVIDEANRTVVLTENETFVIEKEHMIDIAPKNRPRKVYTGMWGPVEIATAGAAMLAIVASVLLYVLLVVPSNNELENSRLRRASLEKEMISAREKYGNISNTETEVARVLSSVTDFESRYLPVAATGRTALYQRINGLIASYGLVNTTGPEYAPLDLFDPNKNPNEEERGKAKFKSIFPGVYVTTTLEGPYVNIRRFIREMETGNEFVVISAVELEPSETEQKDGPQANPAQASTAVPFNPTQGPMPPANTSIRIQPAAPVAQQLSGSGGRTRGSTVRLRLEMAAYFRRPNAAPPVETVTQ